jgi:hypothetical protein
MEKPMKKEMMICCYLLVVFLYTHLCWAKMCKWVDENGIAHYTDCSSEISKNSDEVEESETYDDESGNLDEFENHDTINSKKIEDRSKIKERSTISDSLYQILENNTCFAFADQLGEELVSRIQEDSFKRVPIETLESLLPLNDGIEYIINYMDIESIYIGYPSEIETVFVILYEGEYIYRDKEKDPKREKAAMIFWHFEGTNDIGSQYQKKYLVYSKDLIKWCIEKRIEICPDAQKNKGRTPQKTKY